MKVLAPLATPLAGTDIDVGALVDYGPPLRLKPGAIEAAIRRAHDVRATAFRETIGALWRFGTRPAPDAGVGRPCPTA
jgi:hypothetical protein